MTARAFIRKADLNRAVEVAKQHGFSVEVDGGKIRLLPIRANAPLPSDDFDESAWEGRLSEWRRSE